MSAPHPTPTPPPPATRFDPAPPRSIYRPLSRRHRLAALVWPIAWLALARWTPNRLNPWRLFLLRCFGADAAPSAFVHAAACIRFPWNLTLHPHAHVCPSVILDCMDRIQIGPGAHLDRHAHLCAATLDYQDPDMPIRTAPILIGEGARIGVDAFIGPGVRVGPGASVEARTSLFKDLPPQAVATGDPLQILSGD